MVSPSGKSSWMLGMRVSSFRLPPPLNISPRLPCSHKVIPQRSMSTHWQWWSKVWVECACPQTFGPCTRPQEFAAWGAASSAFWASSEGFPTVSLCRSTLLSRWYVSKYFRLILGALWAILGNNPSRSHDYTFGCPDDPRCLVFLLMGVKHSGADYVISKVADWLHHSHHSPSKALKISNFWILIFIEELKDEMIKPCLLKQLIIGITG